jgi:hypothetical protein
VVGVLIIAEISTRTQSCALKSILCLVMMTLLTSPEMIVIYNDVSLTYEVCFLPHGIDRFSSVSLEIVVTIMFR